MDDNRNEYSDRSPSRGDPDTAMENGDSQNLENTEPNPCARPEVLKDIGRRATWRLSTWKPGYGVQSLLAESTELFWQSDAPQPHHVDIHFAKRVAISKIMLYLDYSKDESYTPAKIAVLAGTGYHDLHEVLSLGMEEPDGWIEVSLAHAGKDGYLKAFLVRLSVIQNHQTGKDTRIRGIKVLSPENETMEMADDGLPFTTTSMLAYSTIR
ncbi:anaphase-promoting complex, subunit 10/DOC domain-containing protein [Lipomyces oligophaga]|uniref:anaphase-promoting complex, subunit 10/DOC domain-containing protein n=1 Tax=Lipomyces oligophaga TaxID=45792 RepID=UPI0034CE1E0D